jgi:osmotically-inducible protein OsmY
MKKIPRTSTALAVLLALAAIAACKTTSSPGRQVDDAAIKTSVKAKLAADVRLSTLTNIEVNSTNGIVTLAGQVRSDEERRMAGEVARSVDGVVRVNNELQVNPR